jgi:lipoprotein-releasing system ATP-binding protein
VANSILTLNKINKVYNPGEASEVAVLHDIDLEMAKGEFVAIMGPSGSGKSTLLNIIGLLDRPTSGTLSINGQNTSGLEDAELTHLRGHKIGFVFQYHYLISAFTALENVMMPLLVDHGFQTERAEQRAKELIDRVGLSQVARHRSNDMSGGQQQRVAIARGLAMNPDILLADEPTGNLDTENTKSIFDLLREVNRTSGTSILLITHNHDLGRQCDRIIQVVDGRIVS